jgi:hypothetical protein
MHWKAHLGHKILSLYDQIFMSSTTQLRRLSHRPRGTLRLCWVSVQLPPLSRIAPFYDRLAHSRSWLLQSSAFSTRAALFNTERSRDGKSQSRPDSEKTESEHVDPFSAPSVSLESLGIGRRMKMFLFAVICIFGTIETWFWCKATWIWRKGVGEKENDA